LIFLRFKNTALINPLLWNLSIDGECSTNTFNSFTHIFLDLKFDNLKHPSLIKLFKDGRFISPFLESWLNQNTNLKSLIGNKTSDFYDENGLFYQLKVFTKYGLGFRPSSQIGSQRSYNQKKFEAYCESQTFILASVVHFPTVKFKLVLGTSLL
jgi:hypothetical protein